MSDRATLVARLEGWLGTIRDGAQYNLLREAISALAAPPVPAFHFHSKRCYATGPGDTEVLVCGLAETPREKDPIKRLHNLVDSLQRCDRCEAEIGDGDTTVLCEKCAAPPAPEGDTVTCLNCGAVQPSFVGRRAAPAVATRCCCVPAPDRSGRQCDKPLGHDGDHWTYGGDTLTWAAAPAVGEAPPKCKECGGLGYTKGLPEGIEPGAECGACDGSGEVALDRVREGK